jgi:hypothetical protein
VTIASCYLSNEGFIFGADSTASIFVGAEGYHYYDHTQKIFEVGEKSTIGAITWGLGGLPKHSYRTLFAQLADGHSGENASPAANIKELAERFADLIWPLYSQGFAADISKCQTLSKKPEYSDIAPTPTMRTKDEQNEFFALKQNLFAGFCIGGYILPNRGPEGYTIACDPLVNGAVVEPLRINTPFWGAPNMINRLIYGADSRMRGDILSSKDANGIKRWTGTDQELDSILGNYVLSHPVLPIRDAIDFVHACIYSTIKAMKFSSLSQICGGPIELAVITTDRPFRWVRHKKWNAAIMDGGGR